MADCGKYKRRRVKDVVKVHYFHCLSGWNNHCLAHTKTRLKREYICKYFPKKEGKRNSDLLAKDRKNTYSSNTWTCYKHLEMFYKI